MSVFLDFAWPAAFGAKASAKVQAAAATRCVSEDGPRFMGAPCRAPVPGALPWRAWRERLWIGRQKKVGRCGGPGLRRERLRPVRGALPARGRQRAAPEVGAAAE